MSEANFNPFAGGEILRISPTTAPQREVVASCKMSAEANIAFNEAVAVAIDGEINPVLLEKAFNTLIARHDILRATFSSLADELCLQQAKDLQLDFADYSELAAAEKQQALDSLYQEVALKPLNLEDGPLLFVWLRKLGDARYELIMLLHHAIADGWSQGLLLSELAELYSREGDCSEMQPAPSFFDFADQQGASMAANADIDYWLERFKQLPPTLDLPLDKTRPLLRSFEATRVDFELDHALVQRLPKAASLLKSSLVNYVLAGYFTLLYRLTGNTDIVVGLPVAGQAAMHRLGQVGHMVQLLPVRIGLDAAMPFAEVVKQVKTEVLNASDHPNFTFGQLLEKYAVDRSRVPLVSTIFNIDQPMALLEFGAATGSVRGLPRAGENFELFLNVVPTSDQLTIEVTYSTALFEQATIDAWMQALQTILQQSIVEGQLALSSFVLSDDLPAVLQASNQTEREVKYADLVSAFAEQVAHNPSGVAVIANNHSLSYRELDDLSTRLALYLKTQQINEGDTVAICCQRSENLLIATLAILKLGAAYLPLDPAFPEDRLVYMLEDSGAVAIVEDELAPSRVKQTALKHIELGSAMAENGLNDVLDPLMSSANRMAYTIYTSGSTGQPKGVCIQNSAMMNFLESMAASPGLCASDKLLAVTTLSFDISVLELFLPLMVGATTVIANSDEVMDGEKLAVLIKSNQISALQATPSTWRMLLASRWVGQSNNMGGGLKALCGGEPLPADLAAALLPKVGELWNMFGPTETTVWSACKRITEVDTAISIGKPIANTQCYILDENLKPLPESVPGELFIGGKGVTLGYHRREELNAERFIQHPDYGRIYRTGDSAKLLASGELQHLGRLDDQVKVRGYRIELGEIETALAESEAIAMAAVYLWERSADDVRLVACLVLSDNNKLASDALDAAALRDQLSARLPAYMVPQHFIAVDHIPLTPNGKLDRRALAKPELEQDVQQQVAAANDFERRISDLWCEVLNIREVGVTDDFFLLGGHSLLGTQLFAKISTEYGVNLSLNNLFLAPTIRKQAKLVIESLKDDISIPAIHSYANYEGLPPASSQQQRIWYLEQIEQDSMAYNLAASFKLTGSLDIAVLQKCFALIVERHSVLRTNFIHTDKGLVQSIRPVLTIDLQPQLLPEEVINGDMTLHRFLKQQAMHSFDLSSDVLFRPALFTINDQEHVLFLLIHHLIFDGWSFDVILHELCVLYNALSQGEQNPLDELPVQYSDYAIWQRELLQSGHMDQQLNYWLDTLGGELPILNLPEDFNRPVGQPHRSEAVLWSLTEEEVVSLEHKCKELGCTLFMLLVSVYALMLHRHSRQQDILIGAPVSGRGQDETSGLLGFFVNTIVLRFGIEPGASFNSWLQQVKQTCLNGYANQDVPYELLVQELKPKRDRSRSAIFQAFFLFQDTRNRTEEFNSLQREQINVDRPGVQTDIDFWVKRQSSGLVGGLEYPVALFEHDSAQRFADSFSQILSQVAARPETPLYKLAAASAKDVAMMASWNDTRRDYGQPLFLDHFYQAVSAQGNKIAVRGGSESLTYVELDSYSNQLAHTLLTTGVASGDYVGVCLSRDVRMVASLLAIWKVGAAYIPLDPAYPASRLLQMLETGSVSVLVTESGLADTLSDYPCRRILIDSDAADISARDNRQPNIKLSQDSLAYVIFTSGSTGKPKGVKVPQGALANFLNSMAEEPSLVAEDILLAVTTLSFDIAGLELFLPMMVGATVVIAEQEQAMDGNKLCDLLAANAVTVMQATPSSWRLLLAAGWQPRQGFKVLCGGEALPLALAEELVNKGVEVWNMYGPTETTIWSTCELLSKDFKQLLIGKPIANTQCYVLDEYQQPVPIGVAGELYIGGYGVTAGYLNREEETALRFLTDPFAASMAAKKMYRTGDRVRWHSDGRLEYFERIDNQVKLRGFRIELGELENVMGYHPGVNECAAAVKEFSVNDKRLVMYTVFEAGGEVTNSELRRFLREHLPDYMIPQLFVELKAMPRTPNGKVDRKALPQPSMGSGQRQERIAPRTATEIMLAEIWCAALNAELDISVEDYFFEIGGHSLLAMDIIYAVEQQLSVTISPMDILVNSLEQIAAKIDEAKFDSSDVGDRGSSNAEKSATKKGGLRRLIGRFKW
ncbi:non-ribosomal peptide synthetase [Oceanicoccus sp. KOV_DT_Chl]|uniref:non-ribosomal peptide synthetase n=1 Tax=Oceanicoccus sp. KOV_DT_Chl TaxID=1904639 RepID=UPI000C7E4C01|nr:non-ribosomal peptide synthetase [Oceanicoccus sp. KOV_DT_Chl]